MDSAPPANKPTTNVKLVLLGEAAVGKSSLVLRFVSNDFQENKGTYRKKYDMKKFFTVSIACRMLSWLVLTSQNPLSELHF